MSATTTNLLLFKYNPDTDGEIYFNFDDSLNDNWDRIDNLLGSQVVASPAPTALSLVNGAQVVQSTRVAPYNVKSIKGRTLVNVLGRSGNFESSPSGWGQFQSNTAFDTSNYATGTQGMKVTVSLGTYGAITYTFNTVVGKKYVFAFSAKNGNAVKVYGRIQQVSQNTASVTDTTKFNTAWSKFTATAATHVVELDIEGAVNTYGYVDSVRVYEVSDAEYAAIDSMTADQIAAKYPYVDDVKPIANPYAIKRGENLLPPFYEWESLDTSIAAVTSPYSFTLTVSPASQKTNYTKVPVVPGQTYTLSTTLSAGAQTGIDFQLADGSSVQSTGFVTTNPLTVIAPANAVSMRVFAANNATAGTFVFSNFMLNLGATALPFKQREDDYLIFPANIHANIDGSIYDEVTYRDGQYWKNSRFKELVLDGSLGWNWSGNFTGYKEITCLNIAPGYRPISAWGTKYDGKILKYVAPAAGVADQFDLSSSGTLFIELSSTDTGWSDSYSPTQAEIQAYFNGWRMYVYGAADPTIPYSSGTKGWCYKGGDGALTGGTSTLPTGPSPAIQKGGYYGTPYKLTYQLAAATTEVIPVEGGITLHEGANQLETGAGMIIRERANPGGLSPTDAYLAINNTYISTGLLKYRLDKVFGVYRNDKLTQYKPGTDKPASNGNSWIQLEADKAASPNVITVTYSALDQYLLTGCVQAIDGEYNTNLKTAVDKLARTQADVLTRVSVLESQKAGKVQPQIITPTLLNSWVQFPNFDRVGYYKDALGYVHIQGLINGSVSGSQIFILPKGYRPYATKIYVLAANNSTTDGTAVINIDGNGIVKHASGYFGWLSFGEIVFKAEQ